MATTQRGIYYNENPDDIADIEAGMKELAESVDTALDDLDDEKVDKVEGKGLSTEDYTTAEKEKLAGAYTKPSGGIPKTDLDNSVQTSLGKADTAIQTHQDITGKEDKSNKVTELTSESTNTQYPSAKVVYDEIKALQDENTALKQELKDTREASYKIYTETPSTNVTLNKTSKNKFIKFGVNGNRKQNTYEGYNLLDARYNVNITSNDRYTLTGKENTTYTLYLKQKCVDLGTGTYAGKAQHAILFYDENNTLIRSAQIATFDFTTTGEVKSKVIATTAPENCVKIILDLGTYYAGSATTLQNVEAMFIEGSYTTETLPAYEPYVGGQPSPNPTYKQDIHAVGDNGNVNVVKCNKNWFDKATIISNSYINSNGIISTQNGVCVSNYIPIEPNSYIYTTSRGSWNSMAYYDKSKTLIIRKSESSGVNQSPENAYYVRYNISNENIDTFMMSKGSTATPYTPHESETFNIPCQKPMPGQEDYFDWDNELEVHKRKIVALTGNESMNYNAAVTGGFTFWVTAIPLNNVDKSNKIDIYCNIATPSTVNAVNKLRIANDGSIVIGVPSDFCGTTQAEIRAKITELYNNGTPIILDIPLAESAIEKLPFTTEQKAVAEQIEDSTSYYEQTNGYSNDPVSPIYDITAVGDQNLVIDEISQALVANGGV